MIRQVPWLYDESRIVCTKPYTATQIWLDNATNTPGLWVVLGNPGVGKTFGVVSYAIRNNIPYLSPPADRETTARKFLRYIASHIAFEEVKDAFTWLCEWCERSTPRLVIDEAVRLNRASFDAIRDLYDRYPFSVVFVGTNELEQKLAYYDTIIHRVTGVWRVPALDEDDISLLFPNMDKSIINEIYCATRGNFRHISLIAERIEQIQPSSIEAETVRHIAKSCLIGGSK